MKITHPALLAIAAAAVSHAWPLSAYADDLIATAEKSSEIRTFVEAAARAGLSPALRTSAQYTVFAPSNSAFARMPAEERDALMKDRQKLAAVLSYHVIPGKILVAEVKPGPTRTLQGGEVELKSDNGKVTVNGANVTLSDIEADNGVIHVIDAVLMPK